METQVFWKKAISSVKKKIWPSFSPMIGCDKPQKTIIKSPKGSLTITVQAITSFLQDIGCRKQKTLKKKAKFPVKKKDFGLYFLALSSVTNLRGQFKRVQKGILEITVEGTRPFLKHLSGCWKDNFSKERQFFKWR